MIDLFGIQPQINFSFTKSWLKKFDLEFCSQSSTMRGANYIHAKQQQEEKKDKNMFVFFFSWRIT